MIIVFNYVFIFVMVGFWRSLKYFHFVPLFSVLEIYNRAVRVIIQVQWREHRHTK